MISYIRSQQKYTNLVILYFFRNLIAVEVDYVGRYLYNTKNQFLQGAIR